MANEEEEVRKFPRLKPSPGMAESSFNVCMPPYKASGTFHPIPNRLTRNHNGGVCLTASHSLTETIVSMSAPAKLFFSTIEVTKQAFYRSALSYAIVNIKPIVPGRASSAIDRLVPKIDHYHQMCL